MIPTFSIIIPVYNVTPYLRECLDSVLAAARTLSKKCEVRSEKCGGVEIICVDDGSTDGSGEILDEWEKKVGGESRWTTEGLNSGCGSEPCRGGENVDGRAASMRPPRGDESGALGDRALPEIDNSAVNLNLQPQPPFDRRALAEMKIAEWLAGVDEVTFEAALERFVSTGIAEGVIQLRNGAERELIIGGAREFFTEFARKVVRLSDSRCVYFVPDPRSKARGITNSQAWAEYAVHAVTNGGALIPGKEFHTRWFNHRKIENFDLISGTLLAEHCAPVLKGNPIADSIKFFGETHDGGDFDVVVRLDEYGNANANMTEVTFEASKVKKRFPRLKPLSEAVEAVVCHQAAGTNPPTVANSVANPRRDDKGVGDQKVGGESRWTKDGLNSSVDAFVSNASNGIGRSSTDAIETIASTEGDESGAQPLTIRVIHQPNAGVSAARNAGQRAATGEWLVYVDGDDVLLPDALVFAASCVGQTGDAFFFKSPIEFTDCPPKEIVGSGQRVDSFEGIGYHFGMKHRDLPGYPWLMMLRREMFAEVDFPVGISMMEDDVRLQRLLTRRARWVFVDKSIYGYRRREDSASARATIGIALSALKAIRLSQDAIDSSDFGDKEKYRAAFLQKKRGVVEWLVCGVLKDAYAESREFVEGLRKLMRENPEFEINPFVRKRLQVYPMKLVDRIINWAWMVQLAVKCQVLT